MALIQLKRTWPGNFRRTVRSGDQVLRVLEWSPGDVLTLQTEAELAAVADDLGKCLQVVVYDEAAGKHLPVPATPPAETAAEPAEAAAAELSPDTTDTEASDAANRKPSRKPAANPLRQAAAGK